MHVRANRGSLSSGTFSSSCESFEIFIKAKFVVFVKKPRLSTASAQQRPPARVSTKDVTTKLHELKLIGKPSFLAESQTRTGSGRDVDSLDDKTIFLLVLQTPEAKRVGLHRGGTNFETVRKTVGSKTRIPQVGRGGADTAGWGGTGPGEAGRDGGGGAVRPGLDVSFSTPRIEIDHPRRLCGITNVLNLV